MIVQNDTKKKWKKNISYSLLSKFFSAVFLFLTDVFLARRLSISMYAEWAYFFSILSMLFYLGWCGVNISSKVYISKCISIEEKRQCVRAALEIRLISSILFSIFLWVVLPLLAPYLGYPQKYPDLLWLFYMATILVFLNGFLEFYKEIFVGLNRFKICFIVCMTESVGVYIFIFILLKKRCDTSAPAYGYMIAYSIVLIVGLLLLLYDLRGLKNRDKEYIKKYAKNIIIYALPVALIGIGSVMLVEMDTFMLGLLSAKYDVAIYGIAKNICTKAIHVNNAFISAVMISFSVITRENVYEKEREYNKACVYNLCITVVVAAGLVSFRNIVVSVLYGDTYLEAGGIILILSIYYVLFAISTFMSSFLDYRKKAGKRSIWFFSTVILNFLLNLLWIPKYGAFGAAWATGLSLVPYTIYALYECRMEWKRLFLHERLIKENVQL